jgi:NAD(P) transhydrogenase
MFAALGCKVTVVEQRRRLLEFCDSQIIEALRYRLRDLNVIFRFDEKVTAVAKAWTSRPRASKPTSAAGSP